MDLGCIDMGCVEKPSKSTPIEKENSQKETAATKPGKINKAKDAMRSSITALNKLTSQISKPPHRKTSSPLNWFPRKKVEPYLKRKIKMLQEVDGMHLTLDETLGDSNPHYSKVLREKIAIREAAEKAMESRKAAMVEASWCRILQAARIESKEAEDQLSKAEHAAAEAFEAARAVGVIMNDIPGTAQNQYKIETSAKGESTTHTVSATFETAFEVDRQVAAAVKAAFVKLASCPPINKDDFKELLRKISENPDNNLSDIERESDESDDLSEVDDGPCKKRQESDNFSMMVDIMLDRLRCLKEGQLASLATIVATSGLNAALAKMENDKRVHGFENTDNHKPTGRRTSRNSFAGNPELPSLDKFLVKRLTRLEREVMEAKNNARKDESIDEKLPSVESPSNTIPDLESMLVKRPSKLEKEIEEARINRKLSETNNKRLQTAWHAKHNVEEVPSLDKVLVKRLTRLEREVQEARNRQKLERNAIDSIHAEEIPQGKENSDMNKIENRNDGIESLDKVLVKHVSRLEKEKQEFHGDTQPRINPKRKEMQSECSLDQVLVKHKSRLEKAKMAAAVMTHEDNNNIVHSVSRRQARERELQAAWGGLSLGNSIRPHVSRLQREKAAWIQAEEEERKKAMEEEEELVSKNIV